MKENGKTVRKNFDSIEEAERFASSVKVIKEAKANQADIITDSTNDKELQAFLRFRLGNKRKLTLRNVTSILSNALPKIGATPTRDTIMAYCAYNKYKSSTALGVVKWIKAYFEFHKKPLEIDWKQLKNALTRSDDKKPKPFLSADDFSKLMLELTIWYQTVYKVMASVGIRVGELARLDGADLNPESFRITLPASKAKGKKERIMYIPNEIRNDFTELFLPITDKKLPLIHRGGDKARVSPVGLGAAFAEHCLKAGLGKRNIHLLRAYAIRMMLAANGGDYEEVRKTCGWDSEEMQRYLDSMDQEKQMTASIISFSNEKIDTTREMDNLTKTLSEQVTSNLPGGNNELSIKSKIDINWITRFFAGKNKDIDALLRVCRALDLEISPRTKKYKPTP